MPGSAGWPPIRPAATCAFCSRTASSTSSTVIAARRDLAGIEPQPHRVVARAEHAHVAHARQPREHVADLDHRVVAQVQRVVAASGERRNTTIVRSGERFCVTRPIWRTTSGRRGSRLAHAVLGLHLRVVEIGAEAERHRDREAAVGRRPRSSRYSAFSTPLICCSSGVMTVSAIVFGDAPG